MITDPVIIKYDRMAGDYDSRWWRYIDATSRKTVEQLHLTAGSRVLDVACGTGVLLALIRQCHPGISTVGLDSSKGMLHLAEKRLGSTVPLLEGSAQSLPFRDDCFDVVASTSAFHYMRQPIQVLREFKRVLRQSGSVVITDWCDEHLAGRIHDRMLRVFNRAHYRSYTRSQCFELFKQAGFHRIRLEKFRIDWLWGLMTATASPDRELGGDHPCTRKQSPARRPR